MSLTLVTCRTGPGCLNGGDFFDWTQLGAVDTPVPDLTVVTSNLGATATLHFENGTAGVAAIENCPSGSGNWCGNFQTGARLLWTNSPGAAPLDITFTNAVGAAGCQIQADFFGPFTTKVEAYDTSNTLLGFVVEDGNSTPNADNSAIFIGVQSDSANVKRIRFFCTACTFDCNDFAINRLDIAAGAPPPPPPGSQGCFWRLQKLVLSVKQDNIPVRGRNK